MSAERNIFCLYADDIRHEVNGKVSLIGMYQGGMNVAGPLPVQLPKLVVSTYINTPLDQPFQEVSVDLMLNDQVLQNISPPAQSVKDMQDSVPQFADSHLISMLMVLVLQPFNVTEEGRLYVKAHLDGKVLESNALRVRVVDAIPEHPFMS
jgi:hypothetical protein